ncbi:hypothetical protein [Actinoallomurus acaciae]|uniref:Phage protein n=1 Tax=Actinoallomurus acaciae TaxID=502577 RepID=A0ABV5Y7G2_9ACTN
MPNTTITLNTDALTRARLVPYIASWSSERLTEARLIADDTGIAYKRERPSDRDDHGVLWMRHTSAPGVGTPQYKWVHPYRQRRAMGQLLCQVCGGPADRDERGILWLVGRAENPWSGAEMTAQPPVCLRCAVPASRACPHLRGRTLALRVGHAPIVGVRGTLYLPGPSRPVRVGPASLLYGDRLISWLHAVQLFRELHDVTVVDLNEELATTEERPCLP